MSFVSYARNFEDVMLWRALKDVKHGFYVDIGANDPEVDSVTKAFYDRGWRGVNIEPIPWKFNRVKESRPRDINLQLVAGGQQGETSIDEDLVTGSSAMQQDASEWHRVDRGVVNDEHVVVPVETLTSIYERFRLAQIHFLKIDAESAGRRVLFGLDLSVIRPWIIVIDSRLSITQVEHHAQWQAVLDESGYELVYFDGLNRYYVSAEHADLGMHFRTPPNVLDDFTLSGTSSSSICELLRSRVAKQERRAAIAETRIREQSALIDELSGSVRHWSQQSRIHEEYVKDLLSSASWRITRPLRMIVIAPRSLYMSAGRLAQVIPRGTGLGSRVRSVLEHQAFRQRVSEPLRRYPKLHGYVKRLAQQCRSMLEGISPSGSNASRSKRKSQPSSGLVTLTPHARDIYWQLKKGMQNKGKK